MFPRDIIAKKRDGKRLTDAEIRTFVDGVSNQSWADYQATALVMAMFINGLDSREQHQLTKSMLESGEVLDLEAIDAPKADKHSTGGVGDKTSLIIAPLAAACGLAVPMISGRGLGHTGGTLDKLESIDGYKVRLTKAEIISTVSKCGFAMAGQTMKIVPADRKLYALRDAAGMIESVPLIVASIMSKKLAESLDVLVLDVKTGSGAFMKTLRSARELAKALVKTGKAFGVKTEAVITDMDEPLGRYVGNSLEVFECLQIMRGEADELMKPTADLSIELTARMVFLSGLEKSIEKARSLCRRKLADGSALEKFQENVRLQGGDVSVCSRPKSLLKAKVKKTAIKAVASGYIAGMDTRAIGDAVALGGGGRMLASDSVDHAVGFEKEVSIGSKVSKGDVLGHVYLRESKNLTAIERMLGDAYKISRSKPTSSPIVRETIG